MDGISYQEQIKAQQQIVDYRAAIAEMIGYVDDNGCRKLKPEYFLSGEVAAYKFLVSWEKDMLRGKDVINPDVIGILKDIKLLLYWADRVLVDNSQESIDGYEEFSEYLWFALLRDRDNKPDEGFNLSLVALAACLEKSRGVPDEKNMYLHYTRGHLTDCISMGEVYSIVHEWLMSMPVERRMGYLEKSEIYRYHFNMLG